VLARRAPGRYNPRIIPNFDARSLDMGYNRSGKRRTERLKRHKREQARLLEKAAAAKGPQKAPAVAAAKPTQGVASSTQGDALG
jgi:hypothetical protein